MFCNRLSGNPCEWKNSRDILALIRPLKVHGDKALPSKRGDIIKRFKEWRYRLRRDDIDEETINEFEKLKDMKDQPEIENDSQTLCTT